MKQELNHEYKTFVQFRVMVGWETDKRIDSIILIDGEQDEEDGEWKGLTQTMKKMIYAKLDETQKANDKKMEKLADAIVSTNVAIVSTNDKVDEVKQDVKLARDEINA